MVASVKGRLNRREWLAGSCLGVLSACSSPKGTGFDGYGLVANAGDSSLGAVDLTRFRLMRTITLNSPPGQIVAAPIAAATQLAFVLTPANGTIHVIDGHLQRTKYRRLSDEIRQFGLSGDGRRLLAVAAHADEVIEVDPATLTPVSRHKLSIKADSLDSSGPDYVAAASASGSIELIQLSSGKRVRADTPPLGAIRFRADGKILLAANIAGRSLLAFDVPSLRVIAELPLAMQPDHLCFNADGGQLFVSGAGMDGVAVVFPYRMLEVEQTLLAGRNPGPMTCSATPAYLFVGSSTGSEVCILNIATRKLIGFVEIGGRPSFITVTPDSQYALVLDEASGDMAVIHVPAIRANRLKTGVALYTMIGVGSRPVDLVVLPRIV